MKILVTLLLFISLAAVVFPAQEAASPDNEGFIRHWLLLAPIPLDAENEGSVEINGNQIAAEAKIQPKEGDEITVRNKKLMWKKHQASEYFIDFKNFVGKDAISEQVIGYAVAYVAADEAMAGIKLAMGSNDQAKVYLNGKQVLLYDDTRTLEKDQNTADNLTLNKGTNTLVFKVINQENNWQGCVRFIDRNGKPVTGIKIRLMPD